MTISLPTLPSRWSRIRLDRVATVKARIGWKALTADEYVPEGFVFLSTPNIKGTSIDFENVNYITEDRYLESPELCLRVGDVLLVKDGNTLGITCLVSNLPRPATVNGSIAVLRPFGIEPRFLRYALDASFTQGIIGAMRSGMGVPHLFQEDIKRLSLPLPPREEQRTIANYLDAEIAHIDAVVEKKRKLVQLLEERIDSLLLRRIGESALVASDQAATSIPIKRILTKMNRPAVPGGEMITAFRDGQVTARMRRRSEGYTESWTDGVSVQGVLKDDVVIHGLDGFAGAVGSSEVDGVCSPVYHVCRLRQDGDPHYVARMLRILAVTGYLGLFASSTRERAVDFRNWDLFGEIPMPDVDATEQRRIASSIRQIAPLKSATERSAMMASEYRQALITAAVTGQLDPTGVAA